MAYGIQNRTNPPAPEVNTVDFNTIVIAGIAPKGPTGALTVCASDTDDAQFGECLDNFDIPKALRTIRAAGGGKVVVINEFDATAHTTQVTDEEQAVAAQKIATAYDPINEVTVANKVVVAVSATMQLVAGVTAGSATITDIVVDGVSLFASPLALSAQTADLNATDIASKINANTGSSLYSAAATTGGALTLTADDTLGASVNGLVPVITIVSGVTLAPGTPAAFEDGVTGVSAHTYVKDTEYTIDAYGRILFLVAVADGQVIDLTYKKLNTTISSTIATAIIGGVVGTTRSGLALIDNCKSQLNLVPKILIVPTYNKLSSVQTAMATYATKWRMRAFYNCSGLTKAEGIASRAPGGAQATFTTVDKRAHLLFDEVYTYNPKTGTNTLDDASALAAGFLSANAALIGPHESPSNQPISATSGAELPITLAKEDPNNASDANQLRAAGLVSFPTLDGVRWWGGNNASFPSNTAVDNRITTMYVSDVLTDSLTDFAFQYIDRNITTGSINSFLGAANGYYSTRKALGWIGNDSEVVFLAQKNPPASLRAGQVTFTKRNYYFVQFEYILMEEDMTVQLPVVAV